MPVLIRGPASAPTPSQYQLAAGESFTPESVTATFDGSGAAGAFLPCLSVFAQSGELLSRTFPAEVAAGDIAKVTFAPLLKAASAAAPAGATLVPFANWVSVNGTVTPGGGAYQQLDGQFLDTNAPSVFTMGPSQQVGVNGLNNVLLINAPGVYTTIAFAAFQVPIGPPDEPAGSLMYCTWDSAFYPAIELDSFEWGHDSITGTLTNPFGGRNRWRPWLADSISLGASDLPPINTNPQEYFPSLYNAGAQNMSVRSWLLSVRWSEAEAQFFP